MVEPSRYIVDVLDEAPTREPATVWDKEGNFLGWEPRECHEHRTVGEHRAWCYDCAEWCSSGCPCVRCERGILLRELVRLSGKG